MKKKVEDEITIQKRKSEVKAMTPTTLIRPGLLKLDEPINKLRQSPRNAKKILNKTGSTENSAVSSQRDYAKLTLE